MNLLFVTQMVDAGDPVMGFVLRQVQALADRGASVVVVANEVRQVPAALDAEVISLGKERGQGRTARGLRLATLAARLAWPRRPVTLFAHMCPEYLNLAAPTIKAAGGRALLWFAHPRDSRTLALAERLADVVLTTVPGSYPRTTPKLRVIGQAIDTARFPLAPPAGASSPCRLLALGRIAPVKGYETVLRGVAAARAAGTDVAVDLMGPCEGATDRAYRDELLRLRDDLGLAEAEARILGGVPHEEVPARLRAATALVNATVAGSADKVIFEAMASGRPVLASNPALADLLTSTGLDLTYPPGDHAALAGRIGVLTAATADARRDASAELRARIERGHSLDHWADTVMALARPATRQPSTALPADQAR